MGSGGLDVRVEREVLWVSPRLPVCVVDGGTIP